MGRSVNRDGMQGGGVSRECDAGGGVRNTELMTSTLTCNTRLACMQEK